MRKLFTILLSLVLTLSVSGQIMSGVVASKSTVSLTNMISNGTFDSATGWSVTGGVTIGSGVLSFDDATNGDVQQLQGSMNAPVLISTAYTVEFDVSGTSGGGLYISFSSTNTGDGGISYKSLAEFNNGHKVVTFTTPDDINDGGFRIVFNNAGDSGGSIDNLTMLPD